MKNDSTFHSGVLKMREWKMQEWKKQLVTSKLQIGLSLEMG